LPSKLNAVSSNLGIVKKKKEGREGERREERNE
jgi:hypothetical protein